MKLAELILETFIKWILPALLSAGVSYLALERKTVRKRNKALEEGIRCLLRSEIVRCHEEYTRLGYCPVYARQALQTSYAAYHTLGGNDVATGLYKDVLHLPTEKGDCRE